ncbi:MAG: DUF3553 domain-containing protein [Phycisphaerales bacterium]
MQHEYKFGDKVVHTGKPEWGSGVVSAAVAQVQDGKACQRLTIRFERAGIKTLSTAFATLKPADQAPEITRALAETENDILGPSSKERVEEIMSGLPEPATDPFASLASRFRATLNLYRFSDDAGSLVDWAAAQSGLKDPLSRFNRHELEQFFRRFQINRDNHLAKLASEIKRKQPGDLPVLTKEAPPGAQKVLRRESAR